AELGDFDEAIAVGEQGVEIAQAAEHATSVATAQWGLGLPHLLRGNIEKALPFLQDAVIACREMNLRTYFHWTAPTLGRAYLLAGKGDQALELMEAALQNDEITKARSHHALTLATLGEVWLGRGDARKAAELADRALDAARTRQQHGYEAWTLKIVADIARFQGGDETAITRKYDDALRLAAEHSMRPLVAHCSFGLAKVYRRLGKRQEAGERLITASTLYR